MSKLDQLRALREARYETPPVTKYISSRVTKINLDYAVCAKVGRPKVHASSADRQRAYRERKRAVADG